MLSEESPKDVFKFWQSMFIEQVCTLGMDAVGKTSFEKGKALGQHYREQGATNWEDALTGMIKGMGGMLKIYGEGTKFHATVTYPYRLCYIGGPKSAKSYGVNVHRVLKVDLFQKCLCFPYLQGLLAAYGKNTQVINEECIIEDGLNYCKMRITFV
jgi:hypothetical protein